MTAKTSILRRSELAVPAANDHMFVRAAGSEADLVFLDLEDATAPAQKEAARAKAIKGLNELDWGSTVRAIRINGLDTQWCHDDIVEVVTGAEEIATASPRLDALIFGVGDFSLSQGARVDTNFDPLGEYPGDFWAYARNKVIVAARIAGIDAIDAPYPDYGNLEGYERDARRAALMGYTGKWAIHPSQITVANKVYAPTDEEIALAERNVAAYREGEKKGLGAVGVNGVLVDAAHVKMAQATLERAALIARGCSPLDS
jgi:citrate lyase subunit beta/citryl-CoA lyase